eukprot:CAMPEP_0114555956 /NCGR_PEP_ID=MMETSP0114-20121206/9023_1 /TAXON_ID=31324 /ORGANISM="Goniomonas sp, Strain m" /LENGTH=51 /DNA_ID=CAMNT_0001741111 /DNA_START=15 /DNA_END=170 /DNA_ORIENTATION=-
MFRFAASFTQLAAAAAAAAPAAAPAAGGAQADLPLVEDCGPYLNNCGKKPY